jgi:hypothetical protein
MAPASFGRVFRAIVYFLALTSVLSHRERMRQHVAPALLRVLDARFWAGVGNHALFFFSRREKTEMRAALCHPACYAGAQRSGRTGDLKLKLTNIWTAPGAVERANLFASAC